LLYRHLVLLVKQTHALALRFVLRRLQPPLASLQRRLGLAQLVSLVAGRWRACKVA
jgi:hypothetical protein